MNNFEKEPTAVIIKSAYMLDLYTKRKIFIAFCYLTTLTYARVQQLLGKQHMHYHR